MLIQPNLNFVKAIFGSVCRGVWDGNEIEPTESVASNQGSVERPNEYNKTCECLFMSVPRAIVRGVGGGGDGGNL